VRTRTKALAAIPAVSLLALFGANAATAAPAQHVRVTASPTNGPVPAPASAPPTASGLAGATATADPAADATCTGSYDWYPDVGGYYLNEAVHNALARITSGSPAGHYELCDWGVADGAEAYFMEDTQNGLCLDIASGGNEETAESCEANDPEEAFWWETSSDGSGTYWLVNAGQSEIVGQYIWMTANGNESTCGDNGAGVYGFEAGHADCAVWVTS
jgi:hypothetical protein